MIRNSPAYSLIAVNFFSSVLSLTSPHCCAFVHPGLDVFSQDFECARNAVHRGGEFGEADAHGTQPAWHPSGVHQQPGHGYLGLGHVAGRTNLGGPRG